MIGNIVSAYSVINHRARVFEMSAVELFAIIRMFMGSIKN